ALIRETVDSFQPLAQARDNRLTLELGASTTAVDADAIRQVVLNLLDNAVRYGPPGQDIRIGLAVENGAAILSVEDAGPGVAPDKQSVLWKKCVRLERDRGAHRGGPGIGLAVVRDLVGLHGGLAWVEQGARGGAKFVVRLPCRETPP